MDENEIIANCVIEYLQKLVTRLYRKEHNLIINGKNFNEYDKFLTDVELVVKINDEIKSDIYFRFSSEMPKIIINGQCRLKGNDFKIFVYCERGEAGHGVKYNLLDPTSIRNISRAFKNIFKPSFCIDMLAGNKPLHNMRKT